MRPHVGTRTKRTRRPVQHATGFDTRTHANLRPQDDPYDPADTEQKEHVDAVKSLIRQALNLWPRVVPSENWDPGAPPASWADRGLEIFLKIQSFSPDDHDLVQGAWRSTPCVDGRVSCLCLCVWCVRCVSVVFM